MPYYVDNERRYAIWLDGKYEWNIGDLSHIEYGIHIDAALRNDGFVDCPTDTDTWLELIDGIYINQNAKLISKWLKYSGSRFE